MDDDAPTTPSSSRGMLSGAKTYLSGGRAKKPTASGSMNASMPQLDMTYSPNEFVDKPNSERNLRLQLSPDKRLRKAKGRSDREGKEKKSSSKKSSSREAGVDSSKPLAKQKIRRRAASSDDILDENEEKWGSKSLPDSKAVKKMKRRGSVGAMESDERGRKARSAAKEKSRVRHSSAGPLSREKSKRGRSTGLLSPRKGKSKSVDDLQMHLGDLPLDADDQKDSASSSERRSKSRHTVDGEGKIKRGKSKKKYEDDTSETGSKKSRSSKKSKDKESKKKKSQKRPEVINESDSTRDIDKVTGEVETVGSLPRFENDRGESNKPESFSNMSDMSASPRGHVSSKSIPRANSDIPFKSSNLQEEVEILNAKLVEMNEENLKAQFTAQAESAKLRKDLREEKLELQRSQTERRELRAKVRERDMIIDESDRKIQALEKAVESQLDKVDDLEEELRRANGEIFDLEAKLADMEGVLAESAAVDSNGAEKEKAYEMDRHARAQRRLEEREKALEEREKKLRAERESVLFQGQSDAQSDQLEEDNRMLLKALNREKDEAGDRLKEKDDEIARLKEELEKARLGISEGGEQSEFLNSAESMEMQRLKSELASRGSNDVVELRRELDASKTEAQAMASKFESAQRRNHLLEEDIDHWKSVNCNLEDELVDWKSQAGNWRAKYEDVVDMEVDDLEPNILPFSLQRQNTDTEPGMNDPASNKGTSESGSAISSLWSKLTTPTPKTDQASSASLREVLARSTFH